jgi:hypothetical protein
VSRTLALTEAQHAALRDVLAMYVEDCEAALDDGEVPSEAAYAAAAEVLAVLEADVAALAGGAS